MLINERENTYYEKVVKRKIRAGELPSFKQYKDQVLEKQSKSGYAGSENSFSPNSVSQQTGMATIKEEEEQDTSYVFNKPDSTDLKEPLNSSLNNVQENSMDDTGPNALSCSQKQQIDESNYELIHAKRNN